LSAGHEDTKTSQRAVAMSSTSGHYNLPCHRLHHSMTNCIVN